jgi:glycosyltransferase involved in cell wall biosynthesis
VSLNQAAREHRRGAINSLHPSGPGAAIPLVSIACVTYNHEAYISDAIDGFLNQKTDFVYEILIGEDASSDRTREIVATYHAKHPSLIKIITSDLNVGQRQNGIRVRRAARGKYVALCEGDDHWIDPHKLQKQVDFLESNLDYGCIFTDADAYYEETGEVIHSFDATLGRLTPVGDALDALLYSNPYRTCTSLFRKDLIYDYDEILLRKRFKMGDYPLWLLLAGRAKVGYLHDSTAVYTVRGNSASNFDSFSNFISFMRSSYRVSVFFSTYYNRPIDRGRLKKIYTDAVIGRCMEKQWYSSLFRQLRCPPLAAVIVAKGYLSRWKRALVRQVPIPRSMKVKGTKP